jgi:hypothetical protein
VNDPFTFVNDSFTFVNDPFTYVNDPFTFVNDLFTFVNDLSLRQAQGPDAPVGVLRQAVAEPVEAHPPAFFPDDLLVRGSILFRPTSG